jgi:hypothetical protein
MAAISRLAKDQIRRLATSSAAGLALISGLSLAAWAVVWHNNLVLAYNDAVSHLNIARRVIDNLQPGLAQIGTVWLPLNHLLYLPLIWNDWAWRTGFAGSIASMAAYVIAVAGVFCTVRLLTGARLPAFVGAAAFALNLNLLYLQTTPLTEAVFLALLVWSVYCSAQCLRTQDSRYFICSGALGFLLVLSRYDGWFVVLAQCILLFGWQLRTLAHAHVDAVQGEPGGRGVQEGTELAHVISEHHREVAKPHDRKVQHRNAPRARVLSKTLGGAIGRVALLAAPAVFAIALWMLWNASFGSPLYFLDGPGSAKAQQDAIAASSGLPAKGHLPTAMALYGAAIIDNVGLQITLLGVIGAGYFLISRSRQDRLDARLLILGLLAAPIIFNVLSLYLGFSTISLPEFSTATDRTQWFNVRYGIIALPALAIGFGLFARWSRPVALALAAIVVLQAGQHWQTGLITVADGTKGRGAFTDADVSGALAQHVRPEECILMSFSRFSPVSLANGLPLRQYIHEGVQRTWTQALDDPARYATWIVVSKTDVGDPVYDALRKHHHSDFEQTFHLVYSGNHADIYQRNDSMGVNSAVLP